MISRESSRIAHTYHTVSLDICQYNDSTTLVNFVFLSNNTIVHYMPKRDQSCEHCRESLGIARIVCIGTYSILCDFGAYTSFYAYTGI